MTEQKNPYFSFMKFCQNIKLSLQLLLLFVKSLAGKVILWQASVVSLDFFSPVLLFLKPKFPGTISLLNSKGGILAGKPFRALK